MKRTRKYLAYENQASTSGTFSLAILRNTEMDFLELLYGLTAPTKLVLPQKRACSLIKCYVYYVVH